MYFVSRNESTITVTGPEQLEVIVPAYAIGIVWRNIDEVPEKFTVACGDMTDAEIVGQVLHLAAFPLEFCP